MGSRSLFAACLAAAVFASVTACGGNPPQIVDYSPPRGAIDVSTAAPIRVTFDNDVDRASVESRLHLVPATSGTVRWLSGRELVYEHATLKVSTSYQVALEAGYRDLAGNVYTLRHHWSFITEGPPSLAGSTPADQDAGIDPAAYLTLDFTRQMQPASLRSAITIEPSVPFDVRLDPTDPRRAIIAPSRLLTPNTGYGISVSTAALDADGNQLDQDQTVAFKTGSVRPLHGWITFAADQRDGTPAGLWMVNESGFPRQLYGPATATSFAWSPDGASVLVEGEGQSWSEVTPGGASVALPFKATWAARLASGMGYAYIDGSGELRRLATDGTDETIAPNVVDAAVSPNGLRLAFIQGADAPNQVWGYDVGLRARYQLATDSNPVSSVAWAPSGEKIAYLRADAGFTTLRVRDLAASGATTSVARGTLASPRWLPDSTHIVLGASLSTESGVVHKAYVIDTVSPPASLNPAAGLPADPAIDVSSPIPSPDGHQIAFLNGGQVWLMNADGTRPVALTRVDAESFPYSCRDPAWTRT